MIKFSVVKGTFTTLNIFNFGTVLTRVKKRMNSESSEIGRLNINSCLGNRPCRWRIGEKFPC